MTLRDWILKTRRLTLFTMLAFLDLLIIGLLMITSLFVLSFSLNFFLLFLAIIGGFFIVFLMLYIPANKLDLKYKQLYQNGHATFIDSKTTKEFKNEVYVRTQTTIHGVTYIKENHEPVHQAFVKEVLDESLVLYPMGSYQNGDTCKILHATLELTLVLYKDEKILVSTDVLRLS